jgi:hypothetical protein
MRASAVREFRRRPASAPHGHWGQRRTLGDLPGAPRHRLAGRTGKRLMRKRLEKVEFTNLARANHMGYT